MTSRAVAMTSPQGDRWIIQMDAFAHKCPGGDKHENHLEKPWTCGSVSRRRTLKPEEAAIALQALGYEVEDL